jgi:hypothetical protein
VPRPRLYLSSWRSVWAAMPPLRSEVDASANMDIVLVIAGVDATALFHDAAMVRWEDRQTFLCACVGPRVLPPPDRIGCVDGKLCACAGACVKSESFRSQNASGLQVRDLYCFLSSS